MEIWTEWWQVCFECFDEETTVSKIGFFQIKRENIEISICLWLKNFTGSRFIDRWMGMVLMAKLFYFSISIVSLHLIIKNIEKNAI